MRTRPAREDSDQLVDALRTIDDLEDKLAGALLAGEALQRQCDASSKPVECDADLVRARDEALDRIASLESALSLSKAERDAAKASLSDRDRGDADAAPASVGRGGPLRRADRGEGRRGAPTAREWMTPGRGLRGGAAVHGAQKSTKTARGAAWTGRCAAEATGETRGGAGRGAAAKQRELTKP